MRSYKTLTNLVHQFTSIKQQIRLKKIEVTQPLAMMQDIIDAKTRSDMVQIKWRDGLISHYPNLWLRDHCQCQQCFHKVSKGKLFVIDDLKIDASPKNLEWSEDSDKVVVHWDCGHVSPFRSSWLRDRDFHQGMLPLKEPPFISRQHLWKATEMEGGNLPAIDFQGVMIDPEKLNDWLVTLRDSGICLIRNSPTEEGVLNRLAKKVAFLSSTHYGPTFMVKAKGNPNNLAYTSGKLNLHTDLPEYSPGIQMLHCIEQSKGDGAVNEFVDGFQAAAQLESEDKSAYDLLTSLKFTFVDQGIEDEDVLDSIQASKKGFLKRTSAPCIETDDEGSVFKINFSDQHRDSMMSVPPEKVNVLYKALKKFNDVLYQPENVLLLKLLPGDIITMDNWRVLHGRTAYSLSSGGRRHLEGGYLDWREVHSSINFRRFTADHSKS